MKKSSTALSIIGLLAIPLLGIAQTDKQSVTGSDGQKKSKLSIEHISPEGLKASPHFSPAIKIKAQNTIYVSGMTGQFSAKEDALEEYKIQLQQAYKKIGIALKAAGATPQDVVRQRVLIKGISPQHASITREVMMQFYGNAKPTSTTSGTSGLFDPELVVEVDVTAVLAE